jgi:hypothetical protein
MLWLVAPSWLRTIGEIGAEVVPRRDVSACATARVAAAHRAPQTKRLDHRR